MAHVKRTQNPIAKILRYFKPQTFKNKKAYTRKTRNSTGKAKFFSIDAANSAHVLYSDK